MRIVVAITDNNWFRLHASRSNVDEVNFWHPSPTANFVALQLGELMLFKLHAPLNFIAGGGFFTRFLHLPISLAWDAFGEANGVTRLDEMRGKIAHYRHIELCDLAANGLTAEPRRTAISPDASRRTTATPHRPSVDGRPQ